MRKEEWISYGVIWTLMVGSCGWFITNTGFAKKAAAEITQDHDMIEDRFLYEQLLLENEEQMQIRQKEEALSDQQRRAEHVATQSAEEQKGKETQAVFSNAVAKLNETGTFLSDCFIVDPNTTLTSTDISLESLVGMDMTMEVDGSNPQILIYHTHATEGYVDSVDGDPATTVVGVGDYLYELLTVRYGYHVLHVTDTYDLIEGTLDRSGAYNYARDGIENVLKEYPEIQVIIDLHRDGVSEERHLVTEIDGKPTAQIMFFNGLSKTNEKGALSSLPNPFLQDNLAFSLQLELLGDHYYPDFIRGIYVKGYRYNLHFRPKSILLEVGAQTNTLQEAKNAMEPFAEILDKLLKGA